jgi:hypothetical protein
MGGGHDVRRSAWRLWRRVLGWAVLCAGLGVVTSISVAWVAAISLTTPYRRGSISTYGVTQGSDHRTWIQWSHRPVGLASDAISSGVTISNAPPNGMEREMPGTLPVGRRPVELPGTHDTMRNSHDFVFGWPSRCLWIESRLWVTSINFSFDRPVMHGVTFQRRWLGLTPRPPIDPMPEALPIGVLWQGMLSNSVIYAGIWLTLLALPIHIRRRLAARAGQCRKCRYDLRGLNPGSACPECGTPQNATPVG